jgi:aspartate ammonia-lyase
MKIMVVRTRTEHDSLGDRQVPRWALYGAQTARAVENYAISGERAAPALIAAYGWLKWAMAQANRDFDLLPEKVAGAIAAAAREVAEHQLDEHFPVDVFQAGAGVSLHMNVNEVVANRAQELLGGQRGHYEFVHPNDHVNRGQSTNDTFPTALRVALRMELDALLPVLQHCQRAFAAKGRQFDRIVKAGRTHLQDAVPLRLGQEFAAYATALGAARAEIARAADVLLELGLGGSAAGTGLNTDPRVAPRALRYLRQATGHRWRQAHDLCAAMQSQFPIAMASAALRNLALELIRICNDLRLLASGPMTGLREIELPALQPGSSIMPGKVNPVMPEMLTMVAFQVVGNDAATALAVQAGQLELNVMMPAMAYATLRSGRLFTAAIAAFTKHCVIGIRARPERCAAYAQSTMALATALTPALGYSRTAKLVQQSLNTGRPVLDLALEQNLLPEPQLRELLDPARAAGNARAPATGARAGLRGPRDAPAAKRAANSPRAVSAGRRSRAPAPNKS